MVTGPHKLFQLLIEEIILVISLFVESKFFFLRGLQVVTSLTIEIDFGLLWERPWIFSFFGLC